MLVEAIIKAIKMRVPEIAAYISARFDKNQLYIKPVQGQLKKEKKLIDLFTYNHCECGVWDYESVVKENLFKRGGENLTRVD